MPKLVKELQQGKAFGRSSEGGVLADTATRVWKIILESPNESFDISTAIGVMIGDELDPVNKIPCVSIDVKGDGESRMVRIVTAQYRSSPMVDGDGGTGLPDPMLVMPDLRPSTLSTSTNLYDMPAAVWSWPGSKDWQPARNAVGDGMEGISKLEPITTIRITQFEFVPGTQWSKYVGYINAEEMQLGKFTTTFEPYTVMFRGVDAQPHVETHGIAVFRGFMNTYEFAYRRNFVSGVYDGANTTDVAVGWNIAVVHEGYNCIAFDPPGDNDDDEFAVPLAVDDELRTIKAPPTLAAGTQAGEKVRAHVKIVDPIEGTTRQSPASMPVALNNNGRPRKLDINGGTLPIIWCKQVQPSIDLTTTLGLRIN